MSVTCGLWVLLTEMQADQPLRVLKQVIVNGYEIMWVGRRDGCDGEIHTALFFGVVQMEYGRERWWLLGLKFAVREDRCTGRAWWC